MKLHKRTKNLLGKKIVDWQVIDFAGYFHDGLAEAHWLCECVCGKQQTVPAKYLLRAQIGAIGGSSCCRSCADKKHRIIITNSVPEYYWRHVKRNADKRNIAIEISANESYELLKSQNFKCALSGLPIRISEYAQEHDDGGTTASLDRINSSQAYTKSNVQWVHKDINMMKHVFSTDYFISLCKLVTDNHR
jgi:hypothetical protein